MANEAPPVRPMMSKLSQELARMFADARHGERAIMPMLLGVRYAEQVRQLLPRERTVVAINAGGGPHDGNKISLGEKMARYVEWKQSPDEPEVEGVDLG